MSLDSQHNASPKTLAPIKFESRNYLTMEVIVAVIASLLGGLIPIFKSLIKPLLIEKNKKQPNSPLVKSVAKIFSIDMEEILPPTPYKERIEKTLSTLKSASDEIDAASEEISSLMKAKQLSVDSLELKLAELSSKENELKTKIEALQNVPLPAVGEFEKMLSKGDKRSALRDYVLFVSGVIVSVIVTVILKKLGY
jgi:hypothetical protein